MDKPIYTIVEEDIQTVARYQLKRDLTRTELDSASYLFANAMNWWDVAESAIDRTVDANR
jgi:hypothetical protein